MKTIRLLVLAALLPLCGCQSFQSFFASPTAEQLVQSAVNVAANDFLAHHPEHKEDMRIVANLLGGLEGTLLESGDINRILDLVAGLLPADKVSPEDLASIQKIVHDQWDQYAAQYTKQVQAAVDANAKLAQLKPFLLAAQKGILAALN